MRSRRAPAETGSFGKSTRRSRSRTGTPAAAKREDPTLAAADAMLSAFLQNRETVSSDALARKPSLSASTSQPNLSQNGVLTQGEPNTAASTRYIHKEPTEVILRGFRASQSYAAIREYERIGGRICEDYPRDAAVEQRKFKSDLRDQASLRRRALTTEEKLKVNRVAMGAHWIKVTFESAEAAAAAIESSPQTIHGYLVYAEAYRGVPPTSDQAVPANTFGGQQFGSVGVAGGSGMIEDQPRRRGNNTLPRSFTTPSLGGPDRGDFASLSPPDSHTSSRTLDTNTLSQTTSATASSATVTGFSSHPISSQQTSQPEQVYCARIPTAKRMTLLPAEQALLPQKSWGQRFVSKIPIIGWFTGDIIGDTVPRTETGEFDWVRASFYWRVMWWIDSWTGLMDIASTEKDD